MGNITTFIATGDSFITRRLPEAGYEGFDKISSIINEHDVRFNNLEITIHNREGYPSAFSGGTWAMADPVVLEDLNRFGFNMYNTANNHSCDYCHGGLLATINYLRKQNKVFAGTGSNLDEASSASFLETKNARVALLGSCSTFHDSDIAGNQGISLSGRPGLNPLRFEKFFYVTKDRFDILKDICNETQMNAEKNNSIRMGYSLPLPEDRLNFGGINFRCGEVNEKHTEPLQKDVDRMIAAIKEAKLISDYVLVSVHAHEFSGEDTAVPAEFLETYCHLCIDAGADAILGHGPHELRAIEIYKNKPIFYSLGNFVFQTETVSLQPAEAYENKNMPYDTKVGAYMNQRSSNGTRGYCVKENIWRSVMAGFTAEDGVVKEIKLYPISLHMELPRYRMGWPTLVDNDEVLKYLADLSKPYGTDIEIRNNIGIIHLYENHRR